MLQTINAYEIKNAYPFQVLVRQNSPGIRTVGVTHLLLRTHSAESRRYNRLVSTILRSVNAETNGIRIQRVFSRLYPFLLRLFLEVDKYRSVCQIGSKRRVDHETRTITAMYVAHQEFSHIHSPLCDITVNSLEH